MRKGEIQTRAYKYNPSSTDCDWKDLWLPEDEYIGSHEFEYDETLKLWTIAHEVADYVANKLVKGYKPLKYNPCPRYATVCGGEVGNGFVGAEIYYRSINSTRRISARMRV